MTIEAVPPGLLLIFGALLLPLLRGRAREAATLLLPVAVLGYVWSLPDGVLLQFEFLGMNVEPVEVDALSRLFATIFAIMAAAGALYAIRQSRFLEIVVAYIYGGAAIGVAFAGDLITVFVFWEIMALASTMVLWAGGSERAWRASFRYLMIHLLGGVVLMVGIVAHVQAGNGTDFTAMKPQDLGTWLILIGFLVNAAAPPLSAWLPDAYPEASPGGMVFLSAFTTKTAVYVLLRGFPGAEILIFVGLYMVFYGIIYALLENDIRRILAYSIVNQVGFMVTGIGIGTEMALNGAAAHAFTHIIYKALLLMSAGSVLYMTGKRKCTDLGGLFQSMPLTTVCGIIGAMAISSFPLTSGFISKSMISQAAVDGQMTIVWFLLAAASAGVFLHAGIKFPWFVFFQKDSGLRPKDPPVNMRWAMILFAFLCIAIGVFPGPLYAMLPYPVDYAPYTGPHVVNMLQLLLFSGAAFFVCLPMMKRTLTISLDFDWVYRKFLHMLGREFTDRGSRVYLRAWERLEKRAERFVTRVYRHHGPEGIMARTWLTGSTALWVAVLLGVYLVLYYV